MYIFNVYMFCDHYNFIDIYIEVLSQISNYCLINKVTHFVFAGDLNTDFSRCHLSNTIVFNKFIAD